MERNEDERFHKAVYKAIVKLADNICSVIYELECGHDPTIVVDDIRMKFKYVETKQVYIATVYRRN